MILSQFSFITGIEAFHFQKLLQVTRILDFQLFASSYSCLWAECIAHQAHCMAIWSPSDVTIVFEYVIFKVSKRLYQSKHNLHVNSWHKITQKKKIVLRTQVQ